MTTKKTSRTRYTPGQRAARAEADKALRNRAADLLADQDAVTAILTHLVTVSRSPKILGYSLRNQAMLIAQASDRGIVLTDVDTFRGWVERGRCVRRGERGLRIVAPRGIDDGEDADAESNSAEEEEEEVEGRPVFRMVAVFDISQTDGMDDAAIVGGPHVARNPVAVLGDALAKQLERRGELGFDRDLASMGHLLAGLLTGGDLEPAG